MEAIDLKIQEAIEIIQVHGRRMKNLIKNDPINNKVDEHWKMSLHAKDMLEKNTSTKSVPLQKNSESNRTIQISNLEPHQPSGMTANVTATKNVNGYHEQIFKTVPGSLVAHYSALSVFKTYFRFHKKQID